MNIKKGGRSPTVKGDKSGYTMVHNGAQGLHALARQEQKDQCKD